ncbi:hypothetical protein D0T84_06375 [Dysgonomonas sp. 521]|nr:hypothetical protein [Dysgonomonas sp. 521]
MAYLLDAFQTKNFSRPSGFATPNFLLSGFVILQNNRLSLFIVRPVVFSGKIVLYKELFDIIGGKKVTEKSNEKSVTFDYASLRRFSIVTFLQRNPSVSVIFYKIYIVFTFA